MRKIGKQGWSYLLFLLLSHHPSERLHRTIRLGYSGRKVYLCARCTGRYLGLVGVFVAYSLSLRFPLWLHLPLILVLPLPAVVDWFTQSCKLRESKNSLRVCTGLLLGIIEGLLLLLLINGVFYMFLVGMTIFGVYAFSIYVIALKTKCLDSYLEDIKRGQMSTRKVPP